MSLSGKRRRVVRFGRGATMTGRVLRPGGVPAVGADVRILEITEPLVEIGRTTAGPDGSFSFAIPPGSNRALIAAFRSDPADPALACSPAARLAVRAKARLRVRPHRLRAGRVVRFRGRVRGPLPPRGKLLDLQAFDGGQWRKFATARTRANGHSVPATVSAARPGRAPTASACACRVRPASPTSAAIRTRRRCASGVSRPTRARAAARTAAGASAPPSGTGSSRRRPRCPRRRSCPGPSRRSGRSPC